MKLWLCWHHDWEHDTLCKIYETESQAIIWLNQIKERITNKTFNHKDFGAKFTDKGRWEASDFSFEERESQ